MQTTISLVLTESGTAIEYLPDDIEAAQAYASERDLRIKWTAYTHVRRGNAMVCRSPVIRTRTECAIIARQTLSWGSRHDTLPATPAALRGDTATAITRPMGGA